MKRYLYKSVATVGTTTKTINIILAAASGSSPNGATPAYVTSLAWANTNSSPPLDVCYCANYKGNTGYNTFGSNCENINKSGFDSGGVPTSWEIPFYNAYSKFAQLFAGYYSGGGSAISSYIGYIRFGLLTGGGTVVPCPAVEEGIYPYGSMPMQMGKPVGPLSELVLEQYATNVFLQVKASSPRPAMTLDASMFGGESFGQDGIVPILWADDIAGIAVANGFGLTAESLASTDLTNYATGSACSNDWCNLFNLYYAHAPLYLSAPMLGLQTLSPSNPSCIDTCVPSNTTGSLVTVLPFATQHHTRVFEVKYVDLLCAYDQNTPYTANMNCPNTPLYAAPFAPYGVALSNSAVWQPPDTSTMAGKANMSGSSAIK